jgi:hypothetical protein
MGPSVGGNPATAYGNGAAAAGIPSLWDPQAFTHIASELDPDLVDAEVAKMWSGLSQRLPTGVGAWDDCPAADSLRTAVRTGKVRSGYDSGVVDDGFNDMADLGLADVDVEVEAELYIADAAPVCQGNGTFGSSTAGAATNTHTDTLTGGATGNAAPGGVGGTVNGSVASADAVALAATDTTTGSMSLPAVVEQARAVLRVKLTLNHTLSSPVQAEQMIDCGKILFQRVAFF